MTDSSNPEHGRPVPVQPVLDYATPAANVQVRPAIPGVLRFAGIYAGVLVPGVCLLWSVTGYPFGPKWQSGKPGDYVQLLLSARSGWPFFPLLVYSMIAMGLVCASPARYARRFGARFGIYTGVVVAAQFVLIMFLGVALGDAEQGVRALIGGAVGTAAPAAMLLLIHHSSRWFGVRAVQLIGVVIVGGALIVAMASGEGVMPIIAAPVFGSVILATPWALAVYAAVAFRVHRLARDELSRRPAMAVPGWLATYAAAWGVAVGQAIRAYHALPTTRPTGCYVATAAARGHRRFVRSRTLGGMPVNDQLRRLKCAEIALAALAPGCHRAVRAIYDRIGPILAAGMVHPLLADLGYVLLTPAEWGSVFLLRRLVGDFDALAAKLYSETENGETHRD